MGNLDIDVDVDLNGVVDEIEDAIHDGAKDAAKTLGKKMQDKAEKKVINENAVFRGRLLDSFGNRHFRQGDTMYARMWNTAPYARPVEEGSTYPTKAPPIHALLPWVRENLSGFRVTSNGDLGQSRAGYFGAIHPDWPGYTVTEVDKAFWLQAKIKRDGIPPVGFMNHALWWVESRGEYVVGDEIKKNFRMRGL